MPIHTFRSGPPIDWATRWLGGMCPAGVLGGLPVRGPDYAAHPPLSQVLTLPKDYPCPPVSPEEVAQLWQTAVGGAAPLDAPHPNRRILLLANPARARALLLQTVGVQPGDRVALPANADLELVEAVKRQGATPAFVPLRANLSLCIERMDDMGVHLGWAQPPVGLLPAIEPCLEHFWLDYARCLPLPTTVAALAPATAVTLFGLHLSPHPQESGALLHFHGEAGLSLYEQVRARLQPTDQPDFARAGAQQQRLCAPGGLAARQWEALHEAWRGLQEAAGLPLLPLTFAGALPHALAVQIPPELEPATFYAYVHAENTPITRLSDHYPIHYAALRGDGYEGAMATAVHLSRWLLVPIGPDYTDEEIRHSVLGIVKAADYLGARWYTNPPHAADYAAMMTELYGPGHDAYRPVFATGNESFGMVQSK
jgi:hypothetical protein